MNNLTVVAAERMNYTNTTTGTLPSNPLYYYEDGDVIQTQWHFEFVVLAYVTAMSGSFSAIRLMEHGLWRS